MSKNVKEERLKECCGRKTCMYRKLSQETLDLMDKVKIQVWSSACTDEMGIEFSPSQLEKYTKLSKHPQSGQEE